MSVRRVCAVVAAAALLAAPAALADGDPASDFLLSQSTFVPFDGGISKAQSDQLAALVAEAKKQGYAIRVALIVKQFDLGAVPSLWLKPHTYARFLGQELFFVYKGRLLVVMPNGYGASKGGKVLPSAQRVVDRLPPPGQGGPAIAAAAMRAVQKLAAQSGVTLTLPKATSGSSTTHDRLVIVAIAVGLVLLFGLGYASRRLLVRRARAG